MTADLARVEKIFTAALEKANAEERADYLHVACGGDVDLLPRLEALLAAHAEASSFLPLSNEDATALYAPLVERPGATIGRYKLLEQIGEGGFGVVFMAEQEQPIRRRVALKVIKLGMDTKQVVARFEAERQALAMMDHPNIAKVFDAGATEMGRPYFVMELVRGVPVTEYCDQARLTTDDRLALFQSVCAAVQHAHQKGIIHRDLKPSNVLVTLHDDKAVPKVIDFGVAKATQARLTERTIFTEFRQMIGTPTYMSPEQAHMSGLDVDTRSDIYSLGVLLYELLTGSTPIDRKQLNSATYDDLKRLICEVEPPSPSARLSTLTPEQLTSLAKGRHCEPSELAVSMRSDLDWIVMKCLEKDRTRRYETANSLAQDIRRYLNNEPVDARRPTRIYRLKKFVRRNKVGVLAGSVVALALVAGLALAIAGFIHARQQAELARSQATRSEQVTQFLKEMLSGVGPSVALGRDTEMLREIVDTTTQRIHSDLSDQPAIRAELLESIGIVKRDLGQYTQAVEMLRESLQLRRELYGDFDASVTETLQTLGETFWQRRMNKEADTCFREAMRIRQKLFGEESVEVADSLFGLAEVLRRMETRSALDEAEATHRKALAIRRRLLGNEHPDVARSLTGLGITLQKMANPEKEACFREALDIQLRVLGSEHPEVAYTLCNLGLSISASGRYTEAEQTIREALRIQKKVLGEHRDTAYSLNFLGSVLSSQRRLTEAEKAHREALRIQTKVLGEHTDRGVTLDYLGGVLRVQGRLLDAEKAFREGVALRKKLLGEEHPYTVDLVHRLAEVLQTQGKLPEAEAMARQHLEILEGSALDDWVTSDAKSILGEILLEQKQYAEAEPLLIAGYEGLEMREGDIPSNFKLYVREALKRVVRVFESTDRPDQASLWSEKLNAEAD